MRMTLGDTCRYLKENITCRQVCDRYSLTVNNSGYTRCVWHTDTKPSLKIYEGRKGCYCYSCGQGGSCLDLARAILNRNLRDTVEQMISDFNMDITLDGNAGRKERVPAPPDYRKLYEDKLRENIEIAKDAARLAEIVNSLLTGKEISVVPPVVDMYYSKVDELEDEDYKRRHS